MGGLIIAIGIIAMVTIHEAGHFLAAKATNMKATEFFFGFGPKLWSTQRGETEYGVKAIPLGGYVRIVGMNPYEDVEPEDEGRTYREKSFGAKSFVVLAGVASHFIVAFILFFVAASVVGRPVATTTVASAPATFEGMATAPAYDAGIRPGDRIVALDGIPTDSWPDLVAVIQQRPGEPVTIEVDRDGERLVLNTVLERRGVGDDATGFLGIEPATAKSRENPIAGIATAGDRLVDATSASAQGMWQLFTGLGDLLTATFNGDDDALNQVRPSSPVGLIQIGTQIDSVADNLELVALVNVFVGLFNLLPAYPLDGGHFVVALYEKVRGRPADVRKLLPIAAAVVIFMILLGALSIYLDIARPFSL